MNLHFETEGTKNFQKFNEVSRGDIFLNKCHDAFVKTNYISGFLGVYNCVRLFDGEPTWFYDDEMVIIPDDYNVKIFY